MEIGTGIDEALQHTQRSKWIKVQIYMPFHICTGYVCCPRQQRLLELLNGTLAGALHLSDYFIPLSEAEMRSSNGEKTVVQSAYISKANILFAREVEDGQTRGLGGQAVHKPYPFIAKGSITVKVHLLGYRLTGQMHYAKGRHVGDALNAEAGFLPLTKVEICSSTGTIEPAVGFIAVNKAHILSLEELGVP